MTHGKIHQITPTETVGNNGFRKRTVIIDRETQYQRYIALEAVKDDCDKFDTVKLGTPIAFEFTASSREYNGRWYNDLRLTAFELQGAPKPQQEPYTGDDQPF